MNNQQLLNGCHVDRDGTRYWYQNGQFHRMDGPAVEWPDGSTEWWRNGVLHRDSGPAIERSNGTKEWWRNGQQWKGDKMEVTELESMRKVVSTLEQLRNVARDTGIEDVAGIVNAAFTMCASLYYLQVRGELAEDPRVDEK